MDLFGFHYMLSTCKGKCLTFSALAYCRKVTFFFCMYSMYSIMEFSSCLCYKIAVKCWLPNRTQCQGEKSIGFLEPLDCLPWKTGESKTVWERAGEHVILVTKPFVYICWLLASSQQHSFTVLSPPRLSQISCCPFVIAIVWNKPMWPLCCTVILCTREVRISILYSLFMPLSHLNSKAKYIRCRLNRSLSRSQRIEINCL